MLNMVGFLQSPVVERVKAEEEEEEEEGITKSQSFSETTDLHIPELDDLPSSFSDSFLDFESLNGWFMEGSGANMADLRVNPVEFDALRGDLRGELGDIKKEFEIFGDGICHKDEDRDDMGAKAESLLGFEQEGGEIGIVERTVEIGDGCERKLGDLGCLIEEQLGKVSLGGQSNCDGEVSGCDGVAIGSCDSVKSDVATGNVEEVNANEKNVDQSVDDGNESGSDEESEDQSSSSDSSSSSSSFSSSSEEEEDEMSSQKKGKNVNEQTEMEDGEIMLSDAEEMIAWSDNEDDDVGGGAGGPIKSKNELTVLPPVPTVNVTLEPHHETLPVGTILSMIGTQVVLEGVKKHNPLNEGSILWISESRSPLGIIDEIFGPVKNPYYIVRYNSEDEVPTGIQQGTQISFVAEFAAHVLNDKSLYQKGYDASNENDEELSDEAEFSDDEKEAEYRRMQKMKKRGKNESKPGNKRKDKRQNGKWNNNQTPQGGITEGQHFTPHAGTSFNQDNRHSSGPRQGLGGDQAVIPPFAHRPQAPGFPPPNGSWNNGFPQHQQQQNANLLSGLPPNGMLWMQQSLPYLFPPPLQTGAPFQQQIGMIPGLPPNFNPMAGQPNFGGTFPAWPMEQNALNQPQFDMGLQSRQGEQAVQPQDSGNMQPSSPAFSFNGGGGGRRGHHRGRGRYGGGKGRRS